MELIIEGTKIDLGDSSPAITKQSVDIDNPSSRFIDFTNKFQLTDSSKLREVFQSPKVIGSNNRSYDKLYSTVLRDVFQIFRGNGFLDSSTKEKYSFQIVDESKELFDNLDISLKDVSWDDLDTVLSQAAIDSLDTADIDNCWFWGKACYHEDALQANTDQTTGDDRCKYSRPAFNVQALLKRAIEENDYSFVSTTPNLAFSSCHSSFYFTSYQKILSDDYVISTSSTLTGLDTNDFAHADLTVLTGSINVGTVATAFRIRGSIVSDSIIDIIIRATDDSSGSTTESKISLTAGTNDVDFTSSDFQSDNGYTIDIYFEGTGTLTFDEVYLYTIISDDSDDDLSLNPFLDYKIKAYDNFPDLTYLDMYRLICVTSNQFHIIDNNTKDFSFGSLATLNKNNSVDWSDKFIEGTEKITGQFKNLYQKNLLKYENDSTVNEKLGWSSFLSDNESFETEGDYIGLAFGASNDVTINSNDIAHLEVYDDTMRIEDQDLAIRLFSIQDSRNVFAPISWENLIETYYKNWFNSLYRIRLIEAQFNLKKLDVLSWHEKQLVYIDYFKTTFIVLKITNFIPKQLTKVKLLAYGR